MSETESICKCQEVRTCRWSNALLNRLSKLPKNHVYYTIGINKVREQICENTNDIKSNVWCCRSGDYARGSELDILNMKDKMPSTNKKVLLSTYKMEYLSL